MAGIEVLLIGLAFGREHEYNGAGKAAFPFNPYAYATRPVPQLRRRLVLLNV